VPAREQDGSAQSGSSGWRRYTSLYEAGHITHLAGRDADISFVTHDNRSHFAVDIGNIDAIATWHWFEALAAAARETGTEVEKILVDRSVIQHLKAELPQAALATKLFKAVIKRAPGHNAHHHLRLLAPTKASEASGAKLLDGLASLTPGSLTVKVDYSVPPPETDDAARTPEAAADSSPTPSR